jgi:hypothetical protein
VWPPASVLAETREAFQQHPMSDHLRWDRE